MSADHRTCRIVRALSVACAIAIAGCGNPLPGLVRALEDSPSPARRRRAALGLRRLKDPAATGPLVKALADDDPGVRAAAALALGEISGFGSEGTPALVKALGDPVEEVRRAAVRALGRTGDPAVAGALIRALADAEADVRAEVARSLGRLRGEVALAGLGQAATDVDPRVRAAALQSLAVVGRLGAAAELARGLSDPDGAVRLIAAKGLIDRPSVSTAGALARALDDPAPGVPLAAAKALVRIRDPAAAAGLRKIAVMFRGELREDAVLGLGEVPGPKSTEALVGLLAETDPDLRPLAAKALGSGLHADASAALVEVLDDASPEVRREAAYSLAAYRRVECVPFLVDDLRSGPRRGQAMDALAELTEPGPSGAGTADIGAKVVAVVEPLAADVRAASDARLVAIMMLAELGRRGLAPSASSVTSAVDSRRADLRGAAALALAEIGDKSSLERVWRIIDDPDPRVRIMSAYAAARLGNGSRMAEIGWALIAGRGPGREMAARLLARLPEERAAKMLVAGLEAPEPGVRALSARGLARRGLDLPLAVKGLAALADDPHRGVRSGAAVALGTIATRGSLAALERFMGDPSVEVRLAACSTLAGAKRKEGVPAAARGLGDTDPRVQAAAAIALTAMTGEDFGLHAGRAPTSAELRAAVLRAQLWWGEHMDEFQPEE